jgi:hypothetical protein
MRIDIENSKWLNFVEIDPSITKRWGTDLTLSDALKGELIRTAQDLGDRVNIRFTALMISGGDSIESSPYFPGNPKIGIKISFKFPENEQKDIGTFVVTFSGLRLRGDDQERISGEVNLTEGISAITFQYGAKVYLGPGQGAPLSAVAVDAFRRKVHDGAAGFLSEECANAGFTCDMLFFKDLTHILSLSFPDSIKFAEHIARPHRGYQDNLTF